MIQLPTGLNTFEMACFVRVRVYRIEVDCMQRNGLRNYKRKKAIVNFEMSEEIKFSCFFYFLDAENS